MASEENSQIHMINSIKDTELDVSAILMEKEFTIGQLTSLNPSNVLTFDIPANSSTQIAVNGKKVATGTVVRVKNNFGVKIDELA